MPAWNPPWNPLYCGEVAFKRRRFNEVHQRRELNWASQLHKRIFMSVCHDLSQCWLNKIKKAFSRKSDPSRYGAGSTVLSFCCVRAAPEFSVDEGKYAWRFFIVVFFFTSKYYKCYLLLQAVLPGLIDTLLHSCQLEFFSMNVFDADIKVFDTEIFRQDTLLIWTLLSHLLLCSLRSNAYGERK